jgi:hypothetical protein
LPEEYDETKKETPVFNAVDDLPSNFLVVESMHVIVWIVSPTGDPDVAVETMLVASSLALYVFVPTIDPACPTSACMFPFFPRAVPGSKNPCGPTTSFVVAVTHPERFGVIDVFVVGRLGFPPV